MTDGHRPRCQRCGKACYASWSDAARDCRLLRRRNKRLRTLTVYYSKTCQTYHLGRR